MYIVNFPCRRCAVEHTMLRSDGRLLCINCLLRRQPAVMDAADRRLTLPRPPSRFVPAPASAA
jgi:hypothetical protein